MATRGSYLHNSMVDFSGASQNFFFHFHYLPKLYIGFKYVAGKQSLTIVEWGIQGLRPDASFLEIPLGKNDLDVATRKCWMTGLAMQEIYGFTNLAILAMETLGHA